MEEQMLFENLDEKLKEETSVITAKWLSINFDHPIREAERLLEKYLNARDQLKAVYLLCGPYVNGEVVVQLVSDKKRTHVETLYASKPVSVVYSVQKQDCTTSSTIASVSLLTKVSPDALKRLTTIPWRPVDPVRPPLVCRENKQEEVKPKASLIPNLANTGKDDQIKVSGGTNFFSSTRKPTTMSAVSQKAACKRPSNFFNSKDSKQPNASSRDENKCKKEPVKSVVGKAVKSPTKVVPVEETPIEDIADEDEDDEDEFLSSAVSRRSKNKKMRLIFDSDEDDVVDDSCNLSAAKVDPSPTLSSDQPKKKPVSPVSRNKKAPTKGRKTVPERLVVDSEPETPSPKRTTTSRSSKGNSQKPLIISSPKKPSPVKCLATVKIAEPSGKQNRRKRQVVKTFTDDDGFMVTEKVLESSSDQDDDPSGTSVNEGKQQQPLPAVATTKPPTVESKTSAPLTGLPTVGGNSRPGKHPARSSKQASLSAFFKRP